MSSLSKKIDFSAILTDEVSKFLKANQVLAVEGGGESVCTKYHREASKYAELLVTSECVARVRLQAVLAASFFLSAFLISLTTLEDTEKKKKKNRQHEKIGQD